MRTRFTADGDSEDTPIERHELAPEDVTLAPTFHPDEVTSPRMLDSRPPEMDVWAGPLGRFLATRSRRSSGGREDHHLLRG
ncbi:MAG: hypothetical protein IPG03_10495 [Candidatus Microthrix sp.]|nr:hypothetical protein [Candidatus Microthrix sp.]MBK6502769.1 hypothetical protein [Candidatus Microthrix sp.]